MFDVTNSIVAAFCQLRACCIWRDQSRKVGSDFACESEVGDAAVNQGDDVTLDLSPEAWVNVRKARAVVDKIVSENRVVYGVTTGFGNFANVVIPPDKVEEVQRVADGRGNDVKRCFQLQYNLIYSHCAGVGEPLAPERALGLLILRLNSLAKGFSGIRAETLQAVRHEPQCVEASPSLEFHAA
jgi:histidine ammonia-lyase